MAEIKKFVSVDMKLLNVSYSLVKKGGTIVTTTQPPSESELTKYGISGKMTFTTYEVDKFNEINQWIEEGKIKIKAPIKDKLSNAS